jgi:ABC-type nitrate/sulfonate/bicarbonate transport system ATPase subunit
MAQRVDTARALALKLRALLFTRLKVQREIQVAVLKLGQPTVPFTTDDASEPILPGDVNIVMGRRPATAPRLIPAYPENRIRFNPARPKAFRHAGLLRCDE